MKAWAHRKFGEPGRRFYRLGYVLFSIPTTLVYVAMIVLLPDARIYTLSTPWIYLTLFIQVAALIGATIPLLSSGLFDFLGLSALRARSSIKTSSGLVTGGLYALCRHPIYFFGLVFLWVMPVMTWNFLAFAIAVTVYTLVGSLFEERKMEIEFGEEYRAYRKKTPWIVPIKFR
jgi:protein-S-isoprenylcysteine O-methyltransferase Ste14